MSFIASTRDFGADNLYRLDRSYVPDIWHTKLFVLFLVRYLLHDICGHIPEEEDTVVIYRDDGYLCMLNEKRLRSDGLIMIPDRGQKGSNTRPKHAALDWPFLVCC